MNKGFKWIAIGTSTLVFVWGIHMIFGPWHNRQLARASFLIIAAVGCIAWGSFELALHTFGRSLAQSRDGSLRSTDKLIASLREGERLLMKTRYRSAASHVFELNAKLDLSLNYGRIDEGCSIYIAHNPELDELNLVEPLSPALARIHVGHGPKVMARRSLQSMRVTEIAGEIRRDGDVLCFNVDGRQNHLEAVTANIEERIPSAKSGTGCAWLLNLLEGAIDLPWELLARERVFGARGELEWSESAHVVRINLCDEKLAERRLEPPFVA